MTLSYHGRIFRSVSNAASGDVGATTTFHYQQAGDVVWGTYAGGAVARGTLVARVLADQSLDMRYQHVTVAGDLKTGRCRSRPVHLPDGRLRLDERWQWTEGGTESGESIVEELPPEAP